MTEIEEKALALLNEVTAERGERPYCEIFRDVENAVEALCRAIEQHEAYKQEVSDAVEAYNDLWRNRTPGRDEFMGHFTRFIIPKPDPLVEAVGEAMQEHEVYSEYELTESLHKALAKRGLKIVEDV